MKELIPKDKYGEKEHSHVLRDTAKITDTRSGLSEVGRMSISRFNSEGYPDPTAAEALENVAQEEKAKQYRPLVYICSPFAGDIEYNLSRVRGYCRFAVSKGTIPIAPHLLFPQFMDDTDSEERELGLFFATVLLGRCCEVWVFGSRVSDGMAREISKAKRRDKPIRYFTERCEEVV